MRERRPPRDEPDLSLRAYRWLTDDANTVILLYLTAAALGLGSIVSYMLGSEGPVSDAQLLMVVASAVIMLYIALTSAGHDV